MGEWKRVVLATLGAVSRRLSVEGEDSGGRHFDNAYLDLRYGELLIRVTRERGRIFASFASTSDPDEWYDWSVVREFLSDEGHLPPSQDRGVLHSLERLRGFLDQSLEDVEAAFRRDRYRGTKVRLRVLEELSRVKRFRGA